MSAKTIYLLSIYCLWMRCEVTRLKHFFYSKTLFVWTCFMLYKKQLNIYFKDTVNVLTRTHFFSILDSWSKNVIIFGVNKIPLGHQSILARRKKYLSSWRMCSTNITSYFTNYSGKIFYQLYIIIKKICF